LSVEGSNSLYDGEEEYTVTPKLEISYISHITFYPQILFTSTLALPPQPVVQLSSSSLAPTLSTPGVGVSIKSEHKIDLIEDYEGQRIRREKFFQRGKKSHNSKLVKFLRKTTRGRKRLKKIKVDKNPVICHVTSDSFNSKSERPFIPLSFMRDTPGTSQTLVKVHSLCDTGASHSVLPLLYAEQMNLQIDNSVPVFIRTASDAGVRCAGKSWLWTKHSESDTWIAIQFLVVKEAKVLIISNRDLKRLKILETRFPYFIGNNIKKRNIPTNIPTSNTSDESEMESVHSVDHNDTDTVRPVTNKKVSTHSEVSTDTQEVGNEYTPPDRPRTQQILSNPIEVEIDETSPENAEEEAAFQILKAIGDEYIFSITNTENIDEEGALDEKEITIEEEEEMIKQKSKFEQSFIKQYRSVFSESLSPSKHLKSEPMRIMLSSVRKEWNSRLYCYRPWPVHIT